MPDASHDNEQEHSPEQEQAHQPATDFDFDGDHDPARSHRLSNLGLQREAAKLANASSTDRRADQRRPKPAPPDHATDRASKENATSSAGHESHKVRVDFGSGTVTGGISLTIAAGTTGVPLGSNKLKALKNTASIRLNGFVAKLETAVLSGDLETEVLDGVHISVNASALTASSDGSSVDFDLMKVSLTLVGDVGHWLDVPDVKLTLEGRVSIAIGGKLAAKLAAVTAAHIEQQMLAKEVDVLAEGLEREQKAINALERDHKMFSSRRWDPALREQRLAEIEVQLAERRRVLKDTTKHIDDLAEKLVAARSKASSAIAKLQGKLARQVARAMETKTAKFVASKLAKLVPVLNLVSTLMDVNDAIDKISGLIRGEALFGIDDVPSSKPDEPTTSESGNTGTVGPQQTPDGENGSAGGAETKQVDGAKTSGGTGQPSNAPGQSGDHQEGEQPRHADASSQSPVSAGNDATREPLSASERASRESARARLSPTARKILDTVTRRGQNGPELDADQITMVGLLVPPDLSASEVWEILDRIGAGEEPSQSGSDVIERIDEAVREVRNRNRTVMVDGKKRPDLAATSNGPAQPEAAEGPITSPGQVDGPITSPGQVQGPQASQTADGARPISDPAVVVYNGPPAVVARWFQNRDNDLVWSPEGKQWHQAHANSELETGLRLLEVQEVITNSGPGRWNLALTFTVRRGNERISITHNYAVERGAQPSELGARAGELVFEPYSIVQM